MVEFHFSIAHRIFSSQKHDETRPWNHGHWESHIFFHFWWHPPVKMGLSHGFSFVPSPIFPYLFPISAGPHAVVHQCLERELSCSLRGGPDRSQSRGLLAITAKMEVFFGRFALRSKRVASPVTWLFRRLLLILDTTPPPPRHKAQKQTQNTVIYMGFVTFAWNNHFLQHAENCVNTSVFARCCPKNTVNTMVFATRSKTHRRKYRGFGLPRRKKHPYL